MKRFCLFLSMILTLGFGLKAQDLDRFSIKIAEPVTEYNMPKEKFDFGNYQVEVYCIKHGSVVLDFRQNGGHYWVYVDPLRVLGDEEAFYGELPDADLILITHDHPDHLDAQAVAKHSKPTTHVFAPASCAKALPNAEVVSDSKPISSKHMVRVIPVPAYNTTPEHAQFHPKGAGVGYLVSLDGKKYIYVAGDTEPIKEMGQFSKHGTIEVALLPVNQPFTMTPHQCAEAVKMLKPTYVMPYHLGNTSIDAINKALEEVKNVKVIIREELR